MRRIRNLLLTFICLFSVISCSNSIINKKTAIRIQLPQVNKSSASRAAMDAYLEDGMIFALTVSGKEIEPIVKEAVSGDVVVFEDIPAGTYEIECKGVFDGANSEDPYLYGKTSAIVEEGKTAKVSLTLAWQNLPEYKGDDDTGADDKETDDGEGTVTGGGTGSGGEGTVEGGGAVEGGGTGSGGTGTIGTGGSGEVIVKPGDGGEGGGTVVIPGDGLNIVVSGGGKYVMGSKIEPDTFIVSNNGEILPAGTYTVSVTGDAYGPYVPVTIRMNDNSGTFETTMPVYFEYPEMYLSVQVQSDKGGTASSGNEGSYDLDLITDDEYIIAQYANAQTLKVTIQPTKYTYYDKYSSTPNVEIGKVSNGFIWTKKSIKETESTEKINDQYAIHFDRDGKFEYSCTFEPYTDYGLQGKEYCITELVTSNTYKVNVMPWVVDGIYTSDTNELVADNVLISGKKYYLYMSNNAGIDSNKGVLWTSNQTGYIVLPNGSISGAMHTQVVEVSNVETEMTATLTASSVDATLATVNVTIKPAVGNGSGEGQTNPGAGSGDLGSLRTIHDVIGEYNEDDIFTITEEDKNILVNRTYTVGKNISITPDAGLNIVMYRDSSLTSNPMFSSTCNLAIGNLSGTITLDGSLDSVLGYGGSPIVECKSADGNIRLCNVILQNNQNYSSTTGAVYMSTGTISLYKVTSENNRNNKNGAAEDVLPDFTVAGGTLVLESDLDIDGIFIDNVSSTATPMIELNEEFSIASGAKNRTIKIVICNYTEGMKIMKVPSPSLYFSLSKLDLFEVYDLNGNRYQLNTDGTVSTEGGVEEENTTDTLKITSVDSTSVSFEYTCNPNYMVATILIIKADTLKDSYDATDFRKSEQDPVSLMTDFGEWYKGSSSFTDLEPDTNYVIGMYGVISEPSDYTWTTFRTDKDNATNEYQSLGDSAPTVPGTYAISSVDDFLKVNSWSDKTSFENITFILTESIDLAGKSTAGYSIINYYQDYPFKGTFDGNNYCISNINLTRTQDALGVFGYVGEGAVIKNLIIDGEISNGSNGASFVGGIVGKCIGNVQIINCTNKAKVSAVSGNGIGGIVGGVTNGSVIIEKCVNEGQIKGYSRTGGIVGEVTGTGKLKIQNCVNLADVEIGDTFVGGILGACDTQNAEYFPILKYCLNYGSITGTARVMSSGAIVGGNYSYAEGSPNRNDFAKKDYIDDCYYTSTSCPLAIGTAYDKDENNNIIDTSKWLMPYTDDELDDVIELINYTLQESGLGLWSLKQVTINNTTITVPMFN